MKKYRNHLFFNENLHRDVWGIQEPGLTLERIASFLQNRQFCEAFWRVDSRITVICDSNFEKSQTAPNNTTVFLPILCETRRGHGGSLRNHRDLSASWRWLAGWGFKTLTHSRTDCKCSSKTSIFRCVFEGRLTDYRYLR